MEGRCNVLENVDSENWCHWSSVIVAVVRMSWRLVSELELELPFIGLLVMLFILPCELMEFSLTTSRAL